MIFAKEDVPFFIKLDDFQWSLVSYDSLYFKQLLFMSCTRVNAIVEKCF